MDTRRKRPKRQSKQSRIDNSAYKPHTSRKSAGKSGNILPARCDTTKKVKLSKESEYVFKSSIAVNTDAVTQTAPQSTEIMARNLAKHITEDSYVPMKTIVYDQTGSPLYGLTPGDSILFKDGRYNSLYGFSNRERAKQRYEDSTQYQEMNQFITTIKSKKIEINSDNQRSVLNERKKARFKRVKSQKAVMGETAKQHMEKVSTTIQNVKFEWAHLLAHAIVGASGQHTDNLVAATIHANTEMIFAEADIPLLNEKYPDGFTLEVTAFLIEGTQAAANIEYKIITPDFQKTYTFDGQNTEQPHICFRHYFHALTKSLIPDCEPSPAKGNAKTMNTVDGKPIVNVNNFFSKREKKEEKENLLNAPRKNKRQRSLY